MLYTIPFLVVMILVSGFIAYWGDLLGRRMGKRRLTLFGLRPRYTAIVVTTIAGMVIAGFTLATMIGSSGLFRKLIVEGPRMIREQKTLRKQNSGLRAQRSGLLESKRKAKESAEQAKRETSILEAEARDRLLELAGVKRELNSTTDQLDDKKDELKTTQVNLLQAQAKYVMYKGREELLRKDISGKLGKPYIVGMNEEIIRRVIHPSYHARQDVIALLNAASDIMLKRGAIRKKNKRAVQILTKDIPYTDPATGKTRTRRLNEDQSIAEIHTRIANSTADVVVVVNAVTNAFEGEQALVDLTLVRNTLAFHKGQDIASAIMDGSRPQGQLLIDIIQFLRQDVRMAAEKAGIIPVYDPENPEAMFGSITEPQEWTDVLDAVSRIKTASRSVVLQLVARKDIYSVGPINLSSVEFVVTSPPLTARGLN